MLFHPLCVETPRKCGIVLGIQRAVKGFHLCRGKRAPVMIRRRLVSQPIEYRKGVLARAFFACQDHMQMLPRPLQRALERVKGRALRLVLVTQLTQL